MSDRNFILNLLNGGYKHIRRLFVNPYKKVGFGWLEVRRLKNLKEHGDHKIPFLGGQINFHDREEFLHSIDEIFIKEIYKQRLGDNPFIIDCGANIGLSVIYLKKQSPSARIIAFEPDDANFALLKKNIEAFNFGNIELRKEAVWIDNTVLNFASEGSMASKIDPSATGKKVEAIRLKDYLREKVDFLKIDIEGAEYAVLKDIEEALVNVNNLFLEYHGTYSELGELCELFNMLYGRGFKFYIKEGVDLFRHPLINEKISHTSYDIQLNIFCFR